MFSTDISFLALLEKKVFIDTFTISNVQFGTKNDNATVLPIAQKQVSSKSDNNDSSFSKFKETIQQSAVVKKVKEKKEALILKRPQSYEFKTSEMLEPVELASKKAISELTDDTNKLSQKWTEIFNKPTFNNELKELNRSWEDFQKSSKVKNKDYQYYIKQIQDIDKLLSQSEALYDKVSIQKKQLDNDINGLYKEVKRIPNLIDQDYKRASKQLKRDDISVKNVTEHYLSVM